MLTIAGAFAPRANTITGPNKTLAAMGCWPAFGPSAPQSDWRGCNSPFVEDHARRRLGLLTGRLPEPAEENPSDSADGDGRDRGRPRLHQQVDQYLCRDDQQEGEHGDWQEGPRQQLTKRPKFEARALYDPRGPLTPSDTVD